MVRRGAVYGIWRDSVICGTKFREIAEKASPYRMWPFVFGAGFAEAPCRRPVCRGVANRIDAIQDVFPIFTHIPRARIDACHAHDCDIAESAAGRGTWLRHTFATAPFLD